ISLANPATTFPSLATSRCKPACRGGIDRRQSIEFTNRVLKRLCGKRSPVWENGVLSGKTESCLGKRSPVWENGVLSGETESWLRKQPQAWENRGWFPASRL